MLVANIFNSLVGGVGMVQFFKGFIAMARQNGISPILSVRRDIFYKFIMQESISLESKTGQ
jgi:hypothetical protein